MHWELWVALIIAVPVILFPAAYLWYANIGGIFAALKGAVARRSAREKREQSSLEVKKTG